MPKHNPDTIRTKEVLSWKGLHLLHYVGSSCSQKLRIFLNIKNVPHERHPVDLLRGENMRPWFLGINPLGLVPVLVHDGAVYTESNDIMAYLEETYPEPPLMSIDEKTRRETQDSLALEDNLHMDLRTLTMRFLVPDRLARKSPDALKAYADDASDTADPHKAKEIAFWESFGKQGISDAQAGASVKRFSDVFDTLNARLDKQDFLAGVSAGVLDIAWFISVHRLVLTGYALACRYPRLGAWYDRLKARDEFSREITVPLPVRAIAGAYQFTQRLQGKSLEQIMAQA